MNEMVERVARAIDAEIFKIEVGSTPERRLEAAARAAIAAMRDPTGAMREAYRKRAKESWLGNGTTEGSLLDAWHAGVDEALK